VRRYESASKLEADGPLDHPRPDRTRARLGMALGAVAIGAEATALTLNAMAAIEYFQSSGESQRDIEAANERVRTLNRASFPFHATAALAGLGWGLSRWWPQSVVVDAGRTPGRPTALSLFWHDRF
jgi:hypothetical protein